MVQDLLPSLIMVLVQFEFAGMNIFSKLALDSGMNPFIHVAYRQIFACIVLAPIAYFIERGKRPPMTLTIFFQVFLCSFFGLTLNQITYYVGLKLSTPTIACALSNLLPAITFVLAVLCRQESAKLKTLAGQAKLIGTFVGVGGAMLLSLYHGPKIPIGQSRFHITTSAVNTNANDHGQVNLVGPILVILSSLTWAIWFIIQAKMSKTYSAPYSTSALMMIMATVECSVFGVIMEPHLEAWSLSQPIRAFASIYAGVVCSGLGVCMMSWCIDKRGPLFVSVFSPLLLVIVAALSWAVLREKLYLGTVLGSILIVMGLYCVLWGKSNETELQQQQHDELKDLKEDVEMQ